MTASALPPGFEALEPFVAEWAFAVTDARRRSRITSEPAARLAFYEAARTELPAALAHLDARGFDRLDDRDERLLEVVLALAHVALAVEQQGEFEGVHARALAHVQVQRASADFGGPAPLPSSTA